MIQRDNGDGTYSSFDENKPMAPIIEPQMIAAYDQLAATLDSPVKKSVQAAIKAFRAGLSVEDTFVLVMQAIRGFSNDPNILAAISALAIVRWAQQWLDEEQTPEVMRKYSHTYYRSLTPDGKLWCESRNPVEVRAQKHPTKKLTYEKYIVHEVTAVLDRPTKFNECLVCKLLDTRLAQIQDANPPLEEYITKSTALWNARLEHAKECTAQMDLVLLIEAATGTGGGL